MSYETKKNVAYNHFFHLKKKGNPMLQITLGIHPLGALQIRSPLQEEVRKLHCVRCLQITP
jgi:hypothetical protein